MSNDLLDIATDQTRKAMMNAGWLFSEQNSTHPWTAPDGRAFTEQAAREFFLDSLSKEAKEKLAAETEKPEQPDNEELKEAILNGHDTEVIEVDHRQSGESHALDEILAAEQVVRERESELEEAKQDAKEAKIRHEKAVEKLLSIIRKYRQPAERDLFDYASESQTDGQLVENNEVAATDVPPNDEEAWRSVSVDEIFATMPAGVIASLKEKDLNTLGQLSNWLNSGKLLTDLDAVGPAKAEKMEACLDSFWQRYNQMADSTTEQADA